MDFVFSDMDKGGTKIGSDHLDGGWRWGCASWHGLRAWKG